MMDAFDGTCHVFIPHLLTVLRDSLKIGPANYMGNVTYNRKPASYAVLKVLDPMTIVMLETKEKSYMYNAGFIISGVESGEKLGEYTLMPDGSLFNTRLKYDIDEAHNCWRMMSHLHSVRGAVMTIMDNVIYEIFDDLYTDADLRTFCCGRQAIDVIECRIVQNRTFGYYINIEDVICNLGLGSMGYSGAKGVILGIMNRFVLPVLKDEIRKRAETQLGVRCDFELDINDVSMRTEIGDHDIFCLIEDKMVSMCTGRVRG